MSSTVYVPTPVVIGVWVAFFCAMTWVLFRGPPKGRRVVTHRVRIGPVVIEFWKIVPEEKPPEDKPI